MIGRVTGEWSRVTCLRVIFFGLAFAAVTWIVGEPLGAPFFKVSRTLYDFFADSYAVAFGICIAFLGGYKMAVRAR